VLGYVSYLRYAKESHKSVLEVFKVLALHFRAIIDQRYYVYC
jgi:hypothetical protein